MDCGKNSYQLDSRSNEELAVISPCQGTASKKKIDSTLLQAKAESERQSCVDCHESKSHLAKKWPSYLERAGDLMTSQGWEISVCRPWEPYLHQIIWKDIRVCSPKSLQQASSIWHHKMTQVHPTRFIACIHPTCTLDRSWMVPEKRGPSLQWISFVLSQIKRWVIWLYIWFILRSFHCIEHYSPPKKHEVSSMGFMKRWTLNCIWADLTDWKVGIKYPSCSPPPGKQVW